MAAGCRGGHHGGYEVGAARRGGKAIDVKALLVAAAIVIGLFVAGSIVMWILHALFSVLGYLILGALAVGAVWFIAGRVRKSINGSGRQQLR